jgi:hypothetical protein
MKPKYRFPLNLQLFAEEGQEQTVDAGTGEVAAPQEEIEVNNEVENTDGEPVDANAASESGAEVVDQPKQSPEMNRAFAELRRQKEAAERKMKEIDDWVRQTYGHMGINTWEEYQQALREEQKRREYEEKGIDYDEMKKIVKEELENHPTVIAARQAERQMMLERQFQEFQQAFPDANVKTWDDLFALPKYEQMHQKIMHGYTIADAYLVTHADEIRQKSLAAARQAALNSVNGKSHIQSTEGSGDVDNFQMPAEVLAEYRRMFAKEYRTGQMKDEDFIKHYKKSLGK